MQDTGNHKGGKESSGNKLFRGGRLLAGGVFESGEAGEDSAKHEDERDEEPDDAPDAARNQRTQGSELGGIRLVHLAEHEVIDNVPDAVQARHDPVK